MRLYKAVFAMLLMLLLPAIYAGAEVMLNEIMASNATVTGARSDDWIELYNSGSEAVSLNGWYLSDKQSNPYKWAFPSGTSIDAGGYLLIYCVSGEVTDGIKGALYAGFSLSAGGDSVYLTSPEGLVDHVSFTQQYGNVSIGIPAGGSEWKFLETATPNGANDTQGFDKRAAEPIIETEAGFYETGVRVTISCREGCEIRYTTDCSTPTRTSTLYTGAINVRKTTVIRAIAISDDMLSSTVAGSTFIIDDPAPIPIPVVSIYTDDKYFFDTKTGFLVKGTGKTPNYEYDWEYPAQIEYFDENGIRQINQRVTTKVSGHSSRGFKQKSLSVYARSALGGSAFRYRFFENRYDEYSAILLRMTSSDNHSCRLRDAVLAQISDGLGLYYAEGKPIIVYINGEYYGHYNLREKSNKDSLAQWEGITDKEIIDGCVIIEGGGMEDSNVIRGTNDEWVELVEFCQNNALDTPEKLNYVLDRVDVSSLFNYSIYSMLINNYDADNVRYYKFPGGKWKFMLHDVEAGGMSADIDQTVNQIFKPRSQEVGRYPHPIIMALLELPEYRDMFLRRLSEIIESNFLYTRDIEPVYQEWMATLEQILPRHISEFPYSGFTLAEWRRNCRASMIRMRSYPELVIDAVCERLNVSAQEKQLYFGNTLELLKIYN